MVTLFKDHKVLLDRKVTLFKDLKGLQGLQDQSQAQVRLSNLTTAALQMVYQLLHLLNRLTSSM